MKKLDIVFYFDEEHKVSTTEEFESLTHAKSYLEQRQGEFLRITPNGSEIGRIINLSLVRDIKIFEEE